MKLLTLIVLSFMSELTHAECMTPAPCIETDLRYERNFIPKVREAVESPASIDLTTFAKGFLGTPYLYGGIDENGIDCSSFVQQVFQEFGMSLPRTSREQYRDHRFKTISDKELVPNDLLFFNNPEGTDVDHVAIYIGEGKMIHSSKSESGVQITDFKFSPFWSKRFLGAKRINFNKESL